mmetsp:Transcript_26872/g.52215  ORF Transcript_26872/g.52215 Transcript_26872/m.52215 type:complete len:265 (+) Transcript_26872:746-1540(+)
MLRRRCRLRLLRLRAKERHSFRPAMLPGLTRTQPLHQGLRWQPRLRLLRKPPPRTKRSRRLDRRAPRRLSVQWCGNSPATPTHRLVRRASLTTAKTGGKPQRPSRDAAAQCNPLTSCSRTRTNSRWSSSRRCCAPGLCRLSDGTGTVMSIPTRRRCRTTRTGLPRARAALTITAARAARAGQQCRRVASSLLRRGRFLPSYSKKRVYQRAQHPRRARRASWARRPSRSRGASRRRQRSSRKRACPARRARRHASGRTSSRRHTA